MAASRHLIAVMDRDDLDFELREIDERILDLLEEGRCTRQYLATQLGVTGDYVYQRVDLLRKLGVVERIHDGFYELADDDRDADADPIEAVANCIEKGRNEQQREANRDLVRVATRWLREQDGPVQKGDAPLEKWVTTDVHPHDRSEKTLWNDIIVVAWRRSELVADTSRSYEWVGEA